jgi:hypothetical protein
LPADGGKIKCWSPELFPAVRAIFIREGVKKMFREIILPIFFFVLALLVVILVILIVETRRLKEIIRKYY